MFNVVFYKTKYSGLRHLEFEGHISEETFIQFIADLKNFNFLNKVKMSQLTLGFNVKMVMESPEV